jgi:hypothetical protein
MQLHGNSYAFTEKLPEGKIFVCHQLQPPNLEKLFSLNSIFDLCHFSFLFFNMLVQILFHQTFETSLNN